MLHFCAGFLCWACVCVQVFANIAAIVLEEAAEGSRERRCVREGNGEVCVCVPVSVCVCVCVCVK